MASAWGDSWGSSWGDAWGAIEEAVVSAEVTNENKSNSTSVLNRYAVEIDGETFYYNTLADAQAALYKAPEIAQNKATRDLKEQTYSPPRISVKGPADGTAKAERDAQIKASIVYAENMKVTVPEAYDWEAMKGSVPTIGLKRPMTVPKGDPYTKIKARYDS